MSDLEDRIMDTQSEQEKKKCFLNKDSSRDLWDNIKHTNIHIRGAPEWEKRDKGVQRVLDKNLAENFLKLIMEIDNHV